MFLPQERNMKVQTTGEVPVVDSGEQTLLFLMSGEREWKVWEGVLFPHPQQQLPFPQPSTSHGAAAMVGKPHRAAKFFTRTKADAMFAVTCPWAIGFASALSHPAFKLMYARHSSHVQDLSVEGLCIMFQKYLRKISSSCNKHKQYTKLIAFCIRRPLTEAEEPSWLGKKCTPKQILVYMPSSATYSRVQAKRLYPVPIGILGLDVIHFHST